MRTLKKLNHLLWFALAALVLTPACTTQKKKGELSGLGKLYHNTTAHYNGFFNAQELLDAAFVTLNEQHHDNYNQLLPVYEYIAADNPLEVAPLMDTAIKKVTIVINLHPYSNWADDCYLVAGKAFFLKKDYESAEKAFRFLLNEYPDEDEKARSGKSAKDRNRRGGSSSSSQSEARRESSQKQSARARKRYNRQVKKRRRKGKSSSSSRSSKKPAAEAAAPAPKPEAPAPAPATPESDPESYFMKHRPAFQESRLWLAKTFIERDNYDGAQRLLAELDEDPKTFDDIRRELPGVQAYLAISQKKYDLAIVYLREAADVAGTAAERARFSYILAQLYQRTGNSQGAYAAFEQVVKNHPPYEMAFSARLNMAQNSYLSGKGSAEDALRNLEKMAADPKNESYRDQIYYAMANIALQQGRRDDGIALLRKSLASSTSNPPQKAEAYYKLANLFFETEDYLAAKLYFDSTLTVMATTDDRYSPTERLRDNLTEIAEALETITLQDSLLRISELSAKDQAALAEKLLREQQEAAAAKAASASSAGAGNKFNPGGRPELALASASAGGRPALQKPSSFFAYDDRAVSRGQREFSRKWSNRPLEDDWRRSNRVSANDATAAEDGGRPNLLSEEEVNQLLAGVPRTDADREKARLAIKQAMFELGRLYRDRLQNNEKAVAILENLNERYPGNLNELNSWYYLYLAYGDLNQPDKAESYKRKIIDKYPSSNFARILQDPNYANEYLNEERRIARQYDAAYALFQSGRYAESLSQARANFTQLLGQHPIKPKYALLIAMCTGNTDGKEAYVAELNKLIATYPDSPEQTRAREILRLLGASTGPSLPGGAAADANSAFAVNQQDLHYIIVAFDNASVDLNAAKNKVSDYNRTFHDLAKLRISNVYLGENNDVPVLVLRRFENQADAMNYYQGIGKNSASFVDGAAMPHKVYAISQANYREVLKARSLSGYEPFFNANYLGGR